MELSCNNPKEGIHYEKIKMKDKVDEVIAVTLHGAVDGAVDSVCGRSGKHETEFDG